MDIKSLIGIINRPWFIEPRSAQHYAEYAASIFRANGVPISDRRTLYGEGSNDDQRILFRVNKDGITDRKGEIQVIRINYPIAKYDLCGDPGSQSLQQIIQAVTNDPSILGTILWMDCPGGQVDGTEDLANTIKKADTIKPIITYSDHMICSGGYWLAANTREIIVHGANNGWNATVGSIGTMCTWEDLSGKYEKEGIKVHYVFADKSKDKWADFFKRNSGDADAYDQLKVELNGINDSFLSAVRDARGNKLSDKEDVLTGKTYNATEALKFGLIDSIGDFQFAVKLILRLATQIKVQQKQTQNSYSMKFPKTVVAAKADHGFEELNEGIWLSHDNLNNIEQTLSDNESAAAATQQSLSTSQAENANLRAEIERQAGEISSLNQRIQTLEGTAPKTVETTIEGDRFDENKPQEFAHNAWADRMMGH